MADSKISGLSAAGTTLAVDDMIVIATAAGATKKATGANVDAGALSQILLTGRGLKSETGPFGAFPGSILTTTGVLRGALCPLRKGVVYTGAVIGLDVAANTISLAKVSLHATAGTLLASTADFSSSITSGAQKYVQVAFGSTYTPAADAVAYACFIFVGTTGPTLMRNNARTGFSDVLVSGGVKQSVSQGSLSDVPSPATFTTSDGRESWIGLY